jgi:hypothetical protein
MSFRNWLSASLGASALLVTGCAASGANAEPTADSARAASTVHGHEAHPHTSAAGRPSEAAQMICSAEIREAVARATRASSVPRATSTWSGQLYTCTYAIRGEPLQLSVKDSPDLRSGKRYFTGLRDRAVAARPIAGLLNFGLPSYRTEDTVVFLKDGKTLTVDASKLPSQGGKSADGLAYAIAASVVACWTE